MNKQTFLHGILYVLIVLVVIVLAFLTKLFFVTAITVDGPSMEPTMYSGDKLIILRANYQPRAKDIVVLRREGEMPIIKRIIALPGDQVDIDFDDGKVYINGELLSEPYLTDAASEPGDVTFPLTVPDGEVFVLGDNRQFSRDSRFSGVGTIPIKNIIGKAVFRYLPLHRIGKIQ